MCMHQLFAVSAKESSALQPNAPSASDIRNALNSNRFPRSIWVGPAPRITRRINTFSPTSGFETYVTWILDVDQVTFVPDLAGGIRDHVAGLLDNISSRWSTPEVVPYSQSTNGSLSWWQSGDAARTRTALEFPQAGGRFDANENPVGPDSPDLRPSTTSEAVNRWVNQGTGMSIGSWAILAVAGLGLLYLGPAIAPALSNTFDAATKALGSGSKRASKARSKR